MMQTLQYSHFKMRPLILALAVSGLCVAGLNPVQAAENAEPQVVEAKATNPLPSPLTLQSLLALPFSVSPQVLMQQAQADAAIAKAQQQDAQDALEVNLQGRLAWREYAQQTEDFHLLALHVGKQLYDFGQSSAAYEAQQKFSQAQAALVEDQIGQYQLQIMSNFFNVLLADMQYRVENEAMAVSYVGLDKAKDRLELKRISEVDYLKLEAEYQSIYVKRERASYEQRRTRSLLVNMVGQPQNLPDKLVLPNLKAYQNRQLDELEKYQTLALAQNIQLQSLKLKQQAALSAIESESAGNKPTVRMDAWGGKLSSYEKIREGAWRFDLSIDVPLYDGGRVSSQVSQAKAELQKINAQIALLEQNLRDDVANNYFKLQIAAAERKQNQAFGAYSDLYLDLSRALYENESTTDLGDAMVRVTQANLQVMQQEFSQALNWAQLDYLTGQKLSLAEL